MVVEQDGSVYFQLRVDGQLNVANVLVLKGEFSITAQVVTTGPPTNIPLYTQLEVAGYATASLLGVGTLTGLVDFTVRVGGWRSRTTVLGLGRLVLQADTNPAIELQGTFLLLVNFSLETQESAGSDDDPTTGQVTQIVEPFATGYVAGDVRHGDRHRSDQSRRHALVHAPRAVELQINSDGLVFFATASLEMSNTSLVKYCSSR